MVGTFSKVSDEKESDASELGFKDPDGDDEDPSEEYPSEYDSDSDFETT